MLDFGVEELSETPATPRKRKPDGYLSTIKLLKQLHHLPPDVIWRRLRQEIDAVEYIKLRDAYRPDTSKEFVQKRVERLRKQAERREQAMTAAMNEIN